jgi:hypothetical protein
MREHHPLPKELGTAFRTGDARELGVTKERLRGSDLSQPFRAVRTRTPPAGAHELGRAYLQRAGDDEFFSHVTAAQLWGLPLPAAFGTRMLLDVAVKLPSFPPQAEGVIGHRLQRSIRVVRFRGLPVVRPVECWVELASVLDVDELVVTGDALVRRVDPLATIDELFDAVRRAKWVRGVPRLRRAVQLVRAGTDSPAETTTRVILVRAGLPEPVIGHKVFDGDRYVGRPDLAYVKERIALEYEGDLHRTDRQQFRRDIERKELFHDARWRTIRVTADHHMNPPILVRRERRALVEAHDSGRSVLKTAE